MIQPDRFVGLDLLRLATMMVAVVVVMMTVMVLGIRRYNRAGQDDQPKDCEQ